MEGGILFRIEQVQHGAGHAGEPAEVADRGGADINAADATEHRLHVADAGGAAVEATSAAT